jgi:UDP-2,3-diacylglucosamine hydrolase
MGNKIYFASDFHFGIPDSCSSLEREKRFVRWLDRVKTDAAEIYLMGDIFDFWFEYKTVVPRGYIRLLGKLAEITDAGIPVHLFRGNHDMWAFNYLQHELNIQLYRDPVIKKLGNKTFYLAHGDGFGPGDHGYKFIKKVFQLRFNQILFGLLHPDFGIPFALFWSRRSRSANQAKEDVTERDRQFINQRLVVHSREVLETHPEIDFFVYGHWHLPVEIQLTSSAKQFSLGDWITHFTYAVFDGENVRLEKFE